MRNMALCGTTVFFPYPLTVSDTTFNSNGFNKTFRPHPLTPSLPVDTPLLEFAFRAHVTTYCTLSNERIIPGPNPNYGASPRHITCVEVFRQPQGDAMSCSGIGWRNKEARLVSACDEPEYGK